MRYHLFGKTAPTPMEALEQGMFEGLITFLIVFGIVGLLFVFA